MTKTIASLAHIHAQMGELKKLRPGTIFSVGGNFYGVVMNAGHIIPGGGSCLSYVKPGETKNRIGEINAAVMRGDTIKTWKPEGV